MLRAIHRWAARHGVEVRLTGIDLNRWSADAALKATPAGAGIDYVTGDLFAYQPSQPPDIILSSLFAHPLDDAALVRFPIGRASCRERVCPYVSISVVAVSLKK